MRHLNESIYNKGTKLNKNDLFNSGGVILLKRINEGESHMFDGKLLFSIFAIN